MATLTEISNMALRHLAVSVDITNVDTDLNLEAHACRSFVYNLRDKCLVDGRWSFAVRFADLVESEQDPTEEWGYVYDLPEDCLQVVRIRSGTRNDSLETKIEYRVATAADGTVQNIYTDEADATVEYIMRQEDGTLYSADFSIALSLLLAVFIAPRLGSGKMELADRALALYQVMISEAQANNKNQDSNPRRLDSTFITGR